MAKPELTPDVSELGLTTPESPPVAGFGGFVSFWWETKRQENLYRQDFHKDPVEIEKGKEREC